MRVANWLSAVVLVASFSLASCGSSDTTLLTADGEALHIGANDSRYVAVNYWAGWCESCMEEVAAMNELVRTKRNRLLVLAVNFDHLPLPALKKAAKKVGMHYPLLVAGEPAAWNLPRPEVLPVTYLLSPSHRLVQTFYGKDTAAQIKRWLSKH